MTRHSLAGTLAIVTILSPSAPADEFGDVYGALGIMETVAGNGVADGNGSSDWLASMEGGPATAADLSRPHMAMADRIGNIYIADKEGSAIRVIRPGGTIHTVAGIPGSTQAGNGTDQLAPGTSVALNNPNGLYTFPDGTTYILDLGNARIRRLGADGMIETVIIDPELFASPVGRGLWVSPDETLIYYSGGSRVRRWRAGLGSDDYGLSFAVEMGNLDVDAAGNVLVTDRFGHRVWRIDTSQELEAIAGTGSPNGGSDGTALGTALNEVRGVEYVEETGGMFLCTHRDSQVWYVDSGGGIHLVLNGDRDDDTHAGDGFSIHLNPSLARISEPRAVVLAPNGDLLVTENDRGYIRRVRSAVSTAAALEIRAFEYGSGSGEAAIRWQSAPGAYYCIERNADLAPGAAWDPVWEGFANRFGNETEGVAPVPEGADNAFFRVKEIRF